MCKKRTIKKHLVVVQRLRRFSQFSQVLRGIWEWFALDKPLQQGLASLRRNSSNSGPDQVSHSCTPRDLTCFLILSRRVAEILHCATMRKRYGTPLGAFRTLPISFSALANVSCLRLTHRMQTESPPVSRCPELPRCHDRDRFPPDRTIRESTIRASRVIREHETLD